MVKHSLVTIGQLILVTIIILFVSYRVALLMDWVPEGFSPGGLVKEEYKAFKENLRQDAHSDDVTSGVSMFVWESINKLEKAYTAENKAEFNQEQVDIRCGENSIYRFFMTMSGSDPHGHCTPTKQKIVMPDSAVPGTVKPVSPERSQTPRSQPSIDTTPTMPGSTYIPAAPVVTDIVVPERAEQSPGTAQPTQQP